MDIKNAIREATMYDYLFKWRAPKGYKFASPDNTIYGHIIYGGKTLSKGSYVLIPDKTYKYEKMDDNNSTNTNNDSD